MYGQGQSHAGFKADSATNAVAVPIYQTVAYAFDSAQHGADLFNLAVPGNIYTRIMNPTTDVLEQRCAALEGGIAGLGVSAGSAAVNYSVLNIAEQGNNIVTVPLAGLLGLSSVSTAGSAGLTW